MDEYREELEVLEEENEEEEIPELPEPLFRVETLLDAQSQKDASLAVRGKAAEIISWVFVGICAVMFGVLLWRYFAAEVRENSQLLYMGILLLALGMYLYNKFFAQKKALKRWEENLQKQFGTPCLHLTMEFFERSLCQSVRETEDTQVEGYSAISGFKESEKLFLLRCGKQQWFFVSKEGFTKGTALDFREFISEKIGGK